MSFFNHTPFESGTGLVSFVQSHIGDHDNILFTVTIFLVALILLEVIWLYESGESCHIGDSEADAAEEYDALIDRIFDFGYDQTDERTAATEVSDSFNEDVFISEEIVTNKLEEDPFVSENILANKLDEQVFENEDVVINKLKEGPTEDDIISMVEGIKMDLKACSNLISDLVSSKGSEGLKQMKDSRNLSSGSDSFFKETCGSVSDESHVSSSLEVLLKYLKASRSNELLKISDDTCTVKRKETASRKAICKIPNPTGLFGNNLAEIGDSANEADDEAEIGDVTNLEADESINEAKQTFPEVLTDADSYNRKTTAT